MILGKIKNYDVCLAVNNDYNDIVHLLKDTAQWLKDRKIDQWQFLLSGGEDEEIKDAINKNETFILRMNGSIVGTFTLYPKQSEWDKEIWG